MIIIYSQVQHQLFLYVASHYVKNSSVLNVIQLLFLNIGI